MSETGRSGRRPTASAGLGPSFLLSQVGFRSSKRWNERVTALGVDSHEAMLLWRIQAEGALSQRALSTRLGVQASRLVGLIDRLAGRGYVARRRSRTDRRTNRIVLTSRGAALVRRIIKTGQRHDAEMTRSLAPREREVLVRILTRVAAQQRLLEGVHPGFEPAGAIRTARGRDAKR